MRRHAHRAFPLFLGLIFVAVAAAQLPPAASEPVDFQKQVEPVFRARCYGCHGPQQQMSGLRLDQRDDALRGGNTGAVIQAGASAESKLIHRVAGFNVPVMPPAGPRLTATEVGILRAWIDQGARWPASTTAKNDPRLAHWSFQGIRRPVVPAVRDAAWVRNPIDAFVLAKLESENIKPSPEADRVTLIRRVSLDLTGLPPSPEEVAAFVADSSPDAYERLVDRLLLSEHYGEKWARQWLDLARYADSDGYEKDLARPYAWRYRNWVIDALNRDMPFDQFTVEQLAGDLLPNATVEQKVATGFHRNTLTNREAGVSRKEVRFEQLVDRANTVSTTWMGLTVGCAQCHNHKYDPILQKDFYQMFAFFNSALEEDIDAPIAGEMGPYLAARPAYDKARAELLTRYGIPPLEADWERNMRQALADPGKRLDWDFEITAIRASLDNAEKMLLADPEKRTRAQSDRLINYFVHNFGPEIAKNEAKTKEFKELRQKLNEIEAPFPRLAQALVLVEDPAPAKNYLYLKGDFRAPGMEVEPGTPAFLPPMPAGVKPTRLTLAQWFISPENPLTARVTVNRHWHELFGRGLVKTTEDFGTQGDKPTHPELLDFLASEFRERGWSLKQLDRLIVTSATYRQASRVREDVQQRDPDNTLLARQTRLRLPAELIRDEALEASGLLNPAVGGPSIKPPQPKGVAELTYGNSFKWVESAGAARYRRGLYIHFQRTAPYPQLMTFDAPDSNVTCSRRRISDTPLQALNLLNDPVFLEAAQALAERTMRNVPGGFSERLAYAFERCVARKPRPRESEQLLTYFNRQKQILAKEPDAAAKLFPVELDGINRIEAAAWTGVTSVLMNMDEFITRE
jgi:mono/diheme cytochrome c family protein